jgi:uridine monophosphate synthetase
LHGLTGSTGTVQKQYTSGPLSIAKWAELITVHVLPGPAIVTALKQAAAAAISSFNTTVHTEISATPNQELDDFDEHEHGSSRDLRIHRPFAQRNASKNSDASLGTSDSDRYDSSKEYRKHSIVSISTTISTRSEPMSPQASKSFFGAIPAAADGSADQEDSFSQLGPIPFLRSCLLLAQMSSAGNLLTPAYTEECLQIGRKNSDFVLGFISQESLNVSRDDNFLTLTPGVKLLAAHEKAGDDLGQQYNSPKSVIQKGTDIIIVGRGIIGADDRLAAAQRYRQEAWSAYEARVGGQP